MTSRTIEIEAGDGGKFSGYLAVPESGSGPGLILGQEIFGINRTMRETADNFAEEGYVVLAPDLFWRLEPGIELGYGEADFQTAFGYFERFDVDRAIDEMLFCFTHDKEIDWLLPGVPPTGKYVEIPIVAVINFRGGKLYHEHIYWDQASVLVQIGLLDPQGLPVGGADVAKKMRAAESLESNALMARWKDSAPGAAE